MCSAWRFSLSVYLLLSPLGMVFFLPRNMKQRESHDGAAAEVSSARQVADGFLIRGMPASQPARRAGDDAPGVERGEEERRLDAVFSAHVARRREEVFAHEPAPVAPRRERLEIEAEEIGLARPRGNHRHFVAFAAPLGE